VFVETELWPNLLHAARGAGVPMGLVGASLSGRSLKAYQRWAPGLMRSTVRAFMAISAQSEADRERFVQLGADSRVVDVGPGLKGELAVPAGIHELAAAWRGQWAPERPLWVAGSTHAGEETICLEAQRLLLGIAQQRGGRTPLLALAPRHPQRFDEVARELLASGLAFARSSQSRESVSAEMDVVMVDEMGALLAWYAAGDAAFVGGSLVPVGGHNLLEPALLSRPVLAGPHEANTPEVAQRLRDAGGLVIVQGAQELAAELDVLFREPDMARQRGARAHAGALPGESGSRAALELVRRLVAARSG
jgi:3-deoxy-D-manno-octulosonic-acid transferase